jgi:hypothetical protein
MWVSPRVYPRVEHPENTLVSSSLIRKQYTSIEMPAMNKRTTLLRTFANHGRNKFYNIGPRCDPLDQAEYNIIRKRSSLFCRIGPRRQQKSFIEFVPGCHGRKLMAAGSDS